MKKYLFSAIAILSSLYVEVATASILPVFRNPDGHTNWQYVANTASSLLITLLSITAITLFFSRRETRRSNAELNEIKRELELRVKERTATLDESNRLLKETNQLLEGEVAKHRQTSERLAISETYMKNVLDSMPLMLIGLDKDGNVTQWNKKAREIAGSLAEEAMGKNLWDIYPIISVSYEQVCEALENNSILTMRHSQRGQYHYEITIYPLQGQIETGAVILVDDVTHQVLSENKLIQRDKMSSMGELASSMAHDINNPLQLMSRDIEEAQQELSASGQLAEPYVTKVQHVLNDAHENLRHAGAIVTNLLEFAKHNDDLKQASSLPDVMDHTIELAENILSTPAGLKFTDVIIERDYEQGLPLIPCYVSELQQVFLSLFRHSLYALSQRAPRAAGEERGDVAYRIKVQIQKFYDAMWIKISHNGLGLSSEEQQEIFEPFFNNDQDRSDDA
ncbi:MAG: PAS domain-containing protein, partial [Pseudomonadales bacterium]|nr:PAS domain-containing protein [Pseudomonadales bacterium]